MRVFCAYAYTGEDIELVTERMTKVRDVLMGMGLDPYVDRFDADTKKLTAAGDFIRLTVGKLVNYDILFVISTSGRRSEGMLMEIGAALAFDKPIVYAQHQTALGKTYIPELAEKTFVWETDDDLLEQTAIYFSALSKS